MPTDFITSLTQFGVAGLMGALWVWERTLSRKRDRQLDETHGRLLRERDAMNVLIRLVRRNTEAIERFERTQDQLIRVLGGGEIHAEESRTASTAADTIGA